jgi:hypothetical protein
MEPMNLGYSIKNIPLAQPSDYLKCLINKTESLLRRMRWKAFFYLNPQAQSRQKETFGFNTTNSPKPVAELNEFESKILHLIQSVEFKKTNCEFQNQLSQSAKDIKKDDKLLIAADKTTNFYRMDPPEYNALLENSMTKTYKKATKNAASKIATEEKKIATSLDLADRIDTTAKSNAFVTLKDHKPNFSNQPTCRLINPSKSEIGIISKSILERINGKIVAATKSNQWKNTASVINWYMNIPNKSKHAFICFDIIEFYPSISEELLKKALKFASKFDTITDQEENIIIQTKKSLTFYENTPWCKKDTRSLFDVTMGSFDGAETCELVGSYLLSELPPQYRNQIGLYRDDGLAVFDAGPRKIESIKKIICKVFSEHNLRLTIEANKKSVNFLDVTLDLRTGAYKPFTKPNSKPLYVHHKSNHPPSIIRNIPLGINRRLSSISSDKESFDAAIPPYQEALKNSGYDHKLEFNPDTTKKKRTRNRNIIWYNPPYSANVATNIGHRFLQLIDECFPKDNELRQIFNRNTLKISYSCMPSIKTIITMHNKSTLAKEQQTVKHNATARECNCRNKLECPLAGKCLTESVVYQATVTRMDNSEQDTYVGLTENQFKTRYRNHTNSFRNTIYRNSTELSKHVWTLKDSNVQFSIKWTIVKQSKSYSNITKRCNLCLYEKYIIICKPELCSLNRRNELVSTCRHRKKFLLSEFGIT